MKAFEESGEHAAFPLTSLAKAKLRAEAFAGAQVADAENQTPSNSALQVDDDVPASKINARKFSKSSGLENSNILEILHPRQPRSSFNIDHAEKTLHKNCYQNII